MFFPLSSNIQLCISLVIASKSSGLGHLYRSLALANQYLLDDIYFVTKEENDLAIQKINDLNYKLIILNTKNDIQKFIDKYQPDIWINDCLDTNSEVINQIKNKDIFVVNFEDISSGSYSAHIVFNALYEWTGKRKNSFHGYKYECLREDIYFYPIPKVVSKSVKKIMIAFGGTDIHNATERLVEVIINNNLNYNFIFNVVLGIGNKNCKRIYEITRDQKNINIYTDVPMISQHINDNDIIISGNGRMVYEAVAMCKPLIVFSQNDRETSHVFSRFAECIIYAGDVRNLSDTYLIDQINFLLDYKNRKNIFELQRSYSLEIRKGITLVISIINEKYEDWKNGFI